MGNRSNINLVGNTTQGQNLGGGDACVFKCKVGGNLLQFRTISATGDSVQIIQTDDEILIYAEGGASGTTYTFENGLTKTLTNVTLGGNLTQNTTISGGTTYGITFNSSSICLVGLPSKNLETCAVYIDSNGKLSTGLAGEGGSGGITGSTNGLTDDGSDVCLGGTLSQNTIFTGGASNYHLQYAADYSTNYSVRSIPDVGWITGNTGGGFLGTVTQTSTEPSNLKDKQWVKPEPTATGAFNYTFSNFLDSGSTAISVNLSLEDVYLRYCDSGYWIKEYYDRPITSGYTWIGDSTNKVCEVRVIDEWVGSESDIDYTGQKYAYPTQSIFQIDVGTCATLPNKIFIQNINLNATGNTCLFSIPTSKCVMISSAKLIMKNNASTDSFTVSIGNNYNVTPSLSYNNMITNCQISNVNLGEVYELLPGTDLQSKISGQSVGTDVCLRVQVASSGTLSANLLLEGFVY